MLIRDVTLTDPPLIVQAEAAGAYELLIELSVLTGRGRRRRSTGAAAVARPGTRRRPGSGPPWPGRGPLRRGLAPPARAGHGGPRAEGRGRAAGPPGGDRPAGGPPPAARGRRARLAPPGSAGRGRSRPPPPATGPPRPACWSTPATTAAPPARPWPCCCRSAPRRPGGACWRRWRRWHEESFAAREPGLVELLAADALATTRAGRHHGPGPADRAGLRRVRLRAGAGVPPGAARPPPGRPALAAALPAPRHPHHLPPGPPARTATSGRPPPRACCAWAGPSATSSASASWPPWPAAPATWTSWPGRSGCPARPSTTTWACCARPGWSGLAGNARRYRYGLRREAVAEATALLASVLTAPGEERP